MARIARIILPRKPHLICQGGDRPLFNSAKRRAAFTTILAACAETHRVKVVAWALLRQRWPPADRAPAFSADAYRLAFTTEQVLNAVASEARYIVDAALVEKMVLVSLVSLCFSQVLPGVRATDFQLTIGIALIVVVNTALSSWLARRGFGGTFSVQQFLVLGVVNLAVILEYSVLRTSFEAPVNIANAHFFIVLLTLLVTLFDRYRQVYVMRYGLGGQSRWK